MKEPTPNTHTPRRSRWHFPIGMRIIKTVLAAFICMTIDYFRGQPPFQSIITTSMCIQPDRESTLQSAFSRALGTVVGAVFGFMVLVFFSDSLSAIHPLLYYFVAALCIAPMIFSSIKLKNPTGVIVSIVVYASMTMTHATAQGSWQYAVNRLVDTLEGIIVALVINLLLHRPLPPATEPPSTKN